MKTGPVTGGRTRVLGVDTSLRSSGVGLVDGPANNPVFVTCGTIRNATTLPHSECLRRIDGAIGELIEEHRPDAVAIEGIFYAKNARTAMILGQARGVVIAVASRAGIPVYEYAPRDVKSAISGSGTASKDQVGRMIAAMLKLKQAPQEDAADALAIALCHLHRSGGVRAEPPKPI